MLSRKIVDNLRKQNWLAVSLDLIVVVAGIFIGLQASEWNDKRLEHQEGLYYLKALQFQLQHDIEEGKAELEKSSGYLASTGQALGLLWKDKPDEGDLKSFQELHLSAFQLWGPIQKPVTLRQLVDDGKIDLIRSKKIQRAILDYESAYVDAIQQTSTSYAYSRDITLTIMNTLDYRGPVITNTVEELRNNRTLVSAIRAKAIMQRIQLQVLESVQKSNLELEEVLESYLSSELSSSVP